MKTPTPQPVVLVTFSCRSGDTEKLALSAAVGAVQARGLIRLRRLPDVGITESTDTLTRMRREYVAPTENDVLGADALILASSPDTSASFPEWLGFLDLMLKLRDEGKLALKVGAAIGGLSSLLADLGLVTIPALSADPVELGRMVANKARSLKASKENS
jgi:hypothetical protein